MPLQLLRVHPGKGCTIAVFLLLITACSPSLRPVPEVRAPDDPDTVARGRYLAEHVAVCIDCHSPRDFSQPGGPVVPELAYGGGWVFDDRARINGEGFPGVLVASNISQDVRTGIGRWSDGEILRAIREGVDHQGEPLFPIMPYGNYRKMSDADALAIVAYLRTVPPVTRPTQPRDLNFPLNFIVNLMPEPLTGPVYGPTTTDPVVRGRYLARIGGCEDCHTPMDGHSPIPELAYAGGNVMDVPEVGRAVASNITPDPQTGIGNWSKEKFFAAMRKGVGGDGRQLNPFMPWVFYAGMTDADLEALYEYLQTVPPIRRDVHKVAAAIE